LLNGDVAKASPDARFKPLVAFEPPWSLGWPAWPLSAAWPRQLALTGSPNKASSPSAAKAIEQLSNDKRDVRLGGIYALDRIAFDSIRAYSPTCANRRGSCY
jgi:hypothetical protein